MDTSELSARIASRLAKDILSGAIAGGAHVGTQQIADRYRVSRTPVREALIALQQIELLEHYPNRGYFVAQPIPRAAAERAATLSDAEHDEYQLFAEDWMTDRLPEVVTEQALRHRYGVTKSKLTELLARAAREGWAERKEGYGWRLLPVAKTAEAFDMVYRFRMAIEPAALLEPSFQVDRTVLAELRRTQETILGMQDIGQQRAEWILDAGADFHLGLIRMSHNPFFVGALERANRTRRLMEYRARVDRERMQVQCTEHLEMLALLDRGELDAASDYMRHHLSGALKRKSPIARSWSAGVTEPETAQA